MGLFQDSSSWLADVMAEHAAVSGGAVYSRGGQSVTIPAWLGEQLAASVPGGQTAMRLEWTDRTVIFRAADLVLGGQRVTPQRYDRIALTLNGEAVLLEVLHPSTGEPPWRYADPTQVMIEIRTKKAG